MNMEKLYHLSNEAIDLKNFYSLILICFSKKKSHEKLKCHWLLKLEGGGGDGNFLIPVNKSDYPRHLFGRKSIMAKKNKLNYLKKNAQSQMILK